MERILLKGVANVPADSACDEGELAVSIGCVPEHGALAPVGMYKSIAQLPDGCKLLCVHGVGDEVRYVFTDDEGLYWDMAGAEGTELAQCAARRISELHCSWACVADDCLVFVDAEGMHIASCTSDGYDVRGISAPMPVIEFELQRAGCVHVSQSLSIPASMAGASGDGVAGSGAWTVHASSSTQIANHESAAKKVHENLMQAIERQVTACGYFHQPFMVRYAVRMTDGNYAVVSPPVAMLPSVLPPCFAIASSVSQGDDECIITFSSTSAQYCRLRYRVLQGLPDAVASNVAAIDIFCSKQMLTYRDDEAGTDGVVDYAAMVKSGDAGYRSSAASDEQVFAGHWSADSEGAADYYLSDMAWASSRCWQLLTDPSWTTRLLSTGEFYRVASIPAVALAARSEFAAVDVSDSGDKALAQVAMLSASTSNKEMLFPDAIAALDSQIVVGGSAIRPMQPWPLRAMIAYAADASESSARITVLADSKAGHYSTALDCDGDIAEARYLYTDIPDAYAIVVANGNESVMLRLTPHPSLPGAYWWGGAGSSPEQGVSIDVDSVPTPASSVKCNARIEVMAVDNPWHSIRQWELPCSRILAMAQSLRAMSSGQFGQYGTYVFADDGLWVLPKSDGEPVMISTDACVAREAVAPVEDGVAYVSNRGVHHVTGSKSTLISADISGMCAYDIEELPQIHDVLAMAGALIPNAFREIIGSARLVFDKFSGRLFLAANSSVQFVYSFESGKWGMCMRQLCYQAGAQYAVCADDAVCDMSVQDASAPCAVALVTRPIRNAQGRISRVRALGRLDIDSCAICLYGSDDLIQWKAVTTSVGTTTDIVTGTSYAYYVVAFVGRLMLPCHVTHICIA